MHFQITIIHARAALVVLGLTLGLYGIRWGLPSPERLARVMPPGLDGPAFQKELADSWAVLHKTLGANLMINPEASGTFTGVVVTPAGWKYPPNELLNSYRSFYLRSEHEDEQSILLGLSRMKPKRLEFNPHLFTYGAPYIYSVGAVLGLGAATGLIEVKSSLLHYLAAPADMADMYLAGRLFSVASYIAVALLLLWIGRRHVGAEAGVLGGALYLMLPASVVQAHVMKPHSVWPVSVLLTLERGVRILKSGSLEDYAAAGALSGLAVALFLGAWPACLIVGAAGAMRLSGLHEPNGRPCRPGPEISGLLLAGACSVAVFFAASPYWALDFREAMLEVEVLRNYSAFNFSHAWLFTMGALRRSITDPALVLFFGGALLALVKGRREPALLLCGVAFLAAVASAATIGNVASARQVRYFMGWVAVGSLLAGRLLQELRAQKGPAGRFGTAAAVIALSGLACQGLAYAHNFRLGEGDRSNHVLAGRWIEANIPAGDTIGLLRYPQPSNSPHFRFDRYRLQFIEPRLATSLPPERLPPYLALTIPDHDDRRYLGPLLQRYERLAEFPRGRLFPWIEIDPTSTTVNPLIEIYRLRKPGA